jgi:hypothetical protein
MLMWTSRASLRFNIENPQHHLISRVSDHPASLRIDSTGNMAAEFKQLNADAV